MRHKRTWQTIWAAGLTAAISIQANAGGWKSFQEPDQTRWKYEDDGAYVADGWVWIDSDHDGMMEKYVFDQDGWLYVSETTPEGITVNEDGAWVVDGKVMTRPKPVGEFLTGRYDEDGSWVEDEDIADTWDRWYTAQPGHARVVSDRERLNGLGPEVADWSEEEEAAWQSQFARYQVTDGQFAPLTRENVHQTFKIDYEVPTDQVNSVYDICNTLAMMLFRHADNMYANYEWSLSDNTDGSVTIHFQYQIHGYKE